MPATLPPHLQSTQPLEQLNVTQDRTEYLLYSTTVDSLSSTSVLFLSGRCANTYSVFVDGALVANTFDYSHNMCDETFTLNLPAIEGAGPHTLTILSGYLSLNNGVN